MNFGAELVDSNLTLIYASAADCKFARKFIPDWSREGGRLHFYVLLFILALFVWNVTYESLNRNKWEFYDGRKRPTLATVRRIDGIFHSHFATKGRVHNNGVWNMQPVFAHISRRTVYHFSLERNRSKQVE